MSGEFSSSIQLGDVPDTGVSRLFQADLLQLTRHLRRPLPELLIGRCLPMVGDEMSWTVRCILRGPLVPPFAEELVEDALASTQMGAFVTVLQRALARLVCAHSSELGGTRFEFYSGLDEQSNPVPPCPHPILGNHLAELGLLVEYTQSQLVISRYESDLHRLNHDGAEVRISAAELRIEDLETQLEASQDQLKTLELKLKTSD